MSSNRKRILFVSTSLAIGGVEKALVSLINALDPASFEIHLALIHNKGDFRAKIPAHVQIHEIHGYSSDPALLAPSREIPRRLLHGRLLSTLPAAWHYLCAKLSGSLNSYAAWLLRNDRPGQAGANPALDKPFDLAVDFPGPPGEWLSYFISDHVKANRRCSFIHFDLDNIKYNPKSSAALYRKVDRVFCVSEQACEVFRRHFPDAASKAMVLHNLVDVKEIMEMGAETSTYSPVGGACNIVTVGRLRIEKGHDIALLALAQLRSMGLNAVWHFVGDGPHAYLFKTKAQQLGLKDFCRFYGSQANPYPFMKQADIYAQPSRHEGYCLTIGEAKIFGTPIVSFDFTGAREQLSDVENALIVPRSREEHDELSARNLAQAIIKAAQMPRLSVTPAPVSHSEEMSRFLELATQI